MRAEATFAGPLDACRLKLPWLVLQLPPCTGAAEAEVNVCPVAPSVPRSESSLQAVPLGSREGQAGPRLRFQPCLRAAQVPEESLALAVGPALMIEGQCREPGWH